MQQTGARRIGRIGPGGSNVAKVAKIGHDLLAQTGVAAKPPPRAAPAASKLGGEGTARDERIGTAKRP